MECTCVYFKWYFSRVVRVGFIESERFFFVIMSYLLRIVKFYDRFVCNDV